MTLTLSDCSYKGLLLRLVERTRGRTGYEVWAGGTLLLISPSAYSTAERAEAAARTFVDEVDRRMGTHSLSAIAAG